MSHFSLCQFFFFNKPFFLSFSWNAHLCLTNCRCLPWIAHSLPVFLHMKNCGKNLVFIERKGLILLRTATGKNWKKNCLAVCKGFLLFTHVFTAITAQVLPELERILSHTSAWMSLKEDFSNYPVIPRWVIYLLTVNYNSSSLAWHPPSAHKHCKPELLLCALYSELKSHIPLRLMEFGTLHPSCNKP